MMDYEEVKNTPLNLAAANWIATAPLAAHISPDCILIDTGSTTTDIIPIKDGKECARGRSDLERLSTGELVYTGTLRTNVATMVDKVPLGDEWVRVASELFAISADVHLALGNIKEEDYTCDTPDGGGKSREDCLLRLSRVVCGDLDLLSHADVEKMAQFVYEKQIEHHRM
jgi:probable H4MPT-linked C1 transfer pathway protein